MQNSEAADDFAYEKLYRRLREALLHSQGVGTRELTVAIKQFFSREYGEHYHVHCSGGPHPEYMVDVLVSSFAPKDLFEKKSLALRPAALEIHLAVESELGGVSASSAFGVMRNAAEDFVKLLLVNAKRRMMIMTSLAYAKEVDHVRARVELLRDMYSRSGDLSSGVLIVHLEGSQPRSAQVQAMVNPSAIRGFVVSNDGRAVSELRT
jgi:hypothetical protein